MTDINLSTKCSVSSKTNDASLSIKHSLSQQHFYAAQYFVEQSLLIEQNDEFYYSDIKAANHRSYVTGAIISAVAGLESSINELYLEARDKDYNQLNGLSNDNIKIIADCLDEIQNLPILYKYQIALSIVGKKYRNEHILSNVMIVIQLRNELIHYRPEWDYEKGRHKTIEKRLKKKIPANPFGSKYSLWFPIQCLWSGCGNWAVDSSKIFLIDFCRRMGIPNRI